MPDVLTDGSPAVASCEGLRARFGEREPALLRGAYRSTVADVTAWPLGGRFPAAVPQFLAARAGNAVVDVCFLDMVTARGNRAVWLIDDSTGETWPLMLGYHDTPGVADLPVGPVT